MRTHVVRILAVDDDPVALDALEETLRPARFGILGAGGGLAGIEQARTERPDLVICYLVMPELDGFGPHATGERACSPGWPGTGNPSPAGG